LAKALSPHSPDRTYAQAQSRRKTRILPLTGHPRPNAGRAATLGNVPCSCQCWPATTKECPARPAEHLDAPDRRFDAVRSSGRVRRTIRTWCN